MRESSHPLDRPLPPDGMLASSTTMVRSVADAALTAALEDAGVQVTATPTGLSVAADPEEIARLALAHGIVVLELRRGERAGLEDLFLSLTSDTDRAHPHRAARSDAATEGAAA